MKSILFWLVVIGLLLYGGYSIFYGESPIKNVKEQLTAGENLSSAFVVEPAILNDSLWKDVLIGSWEFTMHQPNPKYINVVKGIIKYGADGTFSRNATYTHYGYNRFSTSVYDESPGIYDSHIIIRSGIKNQGRWKVGNETWTETTTSCTSKRAINEKHSRVKYYDSSPCSFFPKGGKLVYGTKEKDFERSILESFKSDYIFIKNRNFNTGSEGYIRLSKID